MNDGKQTCLLDLGKVGKGDSSSSETVAMGNVLKVTLEGNVTTGYSWYMTTSELKCLKPLNLGDNNVGEYNAAVQPPMVGMGCGPGRGIAGMGMCGGLGFCGAPGTFNFQFEAVEEGEEVVVLEYKRIWETVDPFSKLNLKVTVTK